MLCWETRRTPALRTLAREPVRHWKMLWFLAQVFPFLQTFSCFVNIHTARA